MLFNKLEQLMVQLDGLVADPDKALTILQRADQVNAEVAAALEAIEQSRTRFQERLFARRQLQEAIGMDARMPHAARRMLAADQLAFYTELLRDMLLFFTGSERGRCVSFNLTVEELLFFIRLLLEEKVMDVETLKSVFLFLSRHARTTGSESLSYESLRKKYSGVGNNAKNKVEALLARLGARAAHHET